LTFEEGTEKLKIYVAEYGDTLVPYTFVDKDGSTLGKWVSRQRENYHTGKLSAERIAVLNKLNFVWTVDHKKAQRKAVDDGFEKFYEHLVAYKKAFGDCDVPQVYISIDGYRLGAAVNKKRVRPERMTEEQISRLKEIGFLFKSENRPWGTPGFIEMRLMELTKYSESDK